MVLILLAYLGGALTILSPCILPVLPFVLVRSSLSFRRGTLPLLLGMAVSFALVASLAAFGGGWAVAANQYGRALALLLLAGFGVILLFPALADRLTRPLVAFGAHLTARAEALGRGSLTGSLVLGLATGFLWAPCAGPVLGVILTGAALNGASLGTSLLLLAYALGAATALGAALLAGSGLMRALRLSLPAGQWLRRGLGLAVVAACGAIGLGLDVRLLAEGPGASTAGFEQGLLDRLAPAEAQGLWTQEAMPLADGPIAVKASRPPVALPVEPTVPSLSGAVQWLNSPPLSLEQLRGKVVLVDFWTFGCVNCLNALPHVKEWAARYADQGLVVIGVHAPEFAYEKDPANVARAVRDLGITFPVALDNSYAIWRQFENHWWPANYFIDARGRVRFHHFGEGAYAQSEEVIRQLLAERDAAL